MYPAISIVLSGNTDKLTLRRLAEKVRDDVGVLPGVRTSKLRNRNKYEISIEIPSERLRQYGLSLPQVAEALRKHSVDVPGGVLKSKAGELQLRSNQTAYSGEALRDIPVSSRSDGSISKLGEIATITDGFDDAIFEQFSNGIPSETIEARPENDFVATARAVREYAETLENTLPEGITYTLRRDNARSFEELLDTLKFEGISGFILVYVVLLLFLSTQVAFWAGSGRDVIRVRRDLVPARVRCQPEHADLVRFRAGDGGVGGRCDYRQRTHPRIAETGSSRFTWGHKRYPRCVDSRGIRRKYRLDRVPAGLVRAAQLGIDVHETGGGGDDPGTGVFAGRSLIDPAFAFGARTATCH